jgi:lysocardiolipin and lysophospholipid acyltransferase
VTDSNGRTLIPAFSIAISQYMGAPLYFYSKDYFYAWMAMTKQQFGVVLTTMTYWWAPVKMRVSGDESVRGQMRKTEDGRLETDFPERMVLISNHQVCQHRMVGYGRVLTKCRYTRIGYIFGG